MSDLANYVDANDIDRLNRIACVCFYGRSGSHLLASFLDNHPRTVCLPGSQGTYLYQYLQRTDRSGSLAEQIVRFDAIYSASAQWSLFRGDFSSPMDRFLDCANFLEEKYRHTHDTSPAASSFRPCTTALRQSTGVRFCPIRSWFTPCMARTMYPLP